MGWCRESLTRMAAPPHQRLPIVSTGLLVSDEQRAALKKLD